MSFAQAQSETSEVGVKFAPADEEFDVTAPCEFSKLAHEQEWRIYKCSDRGRLFLITSVSSQRDSQMEAIKQQAAEALQTKEFLLGRPNATGPFATRYSFKDHDGNFQNAVTVSTARRFYIFHVLSDSEKDSDVESFIDSIGISKRAPLFDTQKVADPRSILTLVNAPGRSSEFVSKESALLKKNPNEGRVFEPTPGQKSPFKLLQKVGASYTGLAVLYQVQGRVILRVTFLSSGQIGKISTVEKLPFGLTANAIAAARFMVFEPSVTDGKAEITSRPVHYQFTIY